ncbi:hypothetical protein QTI17_30095 [Variovorax sp. J31P179]|nr:hypothetical protein [Variovorax sp. J31P179]
MLLLLANDEFEDADGVAMTGWMLTVVGKGSKIREVPVPQDLVDELRDELTRIGRSKSVMAEENADVAILARFRDGAAMPPATWSDSGLYKAVQAFMQRCAARCRRSSADPQGNDALATPYARVPRAEGSGRA